MSFLDAPFRSMRLTWTLENQGGGSSEIELREDQMGAWVVPQRLAIRGERDWGGEINRIEHAGNPNDEKVQWKASGLGLPHRLDYRIVRHDFVVNDSVDVIVEALLSEAQDNQFNGPMGLQMGTVQGTFPSRLRSYCVGVNIGDAIRELATVGQGSGRGFDWEIDADGNLNLWGGGRGVETGRTLNRGMCEEFHVTLDTSELLTNVTAIADPSDPYGPQFRMSHFLSGSGYFFAHEYGRREVSIDTDIIALDEENPDWEQELYDAGRALLKVQGGGLITLHTKWNSSAAPWSMADVWLQDSVTVEFEGADADIFGESVEMRVTAVTVSVEPMPPRDGGLPPVYWIEYEFDGLIRELDMEDGDPDQAAS